MEMKSPHHANPLEVVEAAVGVVDAAWTAIERHWDHDVAATSWEDCIKLERELIQERCENHRLKAAVEELRKALYEVRKADCSHQLIAASASPCEDGCPFDKKTDSSAFLEKLLDMHETESMEASKISSGDGAHIEESSSWVVVRDELFETESREEIGGLDDDGFLLVGQDDVIESLAAFAAKLVVSNPSAKAMTPMQMQEVISMSFARMEHKGKLRKLWSIAKIIYSSVTWTTTVATTAVGLYKNPFIVKALLKALTMSSRVVIKALV